MQPQHPRPDNYDSGPIVAAHFSPTPTLTVLPLGHRYNQRSGDSVAERIREECRKIYAAYGLQRCPHHGLYRAGTKEDNQEPDQTMIVLVMELRARDLEKWRLINDDVRGLLEKFCLAKLQRVCMRYYKYRNDCTLPPLGVPGVLPRMLPSLGVLQAGMDDCTLPPVGFPDDFPVMLPSLDTMRRAEWTRGLPAVDEEASDETVANESSRSDDWTLYSDDDQTADGTS